MNGWKMNFRSFFGFQTIFKVFFLLVFGGVRFKDLVLGEEEGMFLFSLFASRLGVRTDSLDLPASSSWKRRLFSGSPTKI